MDDGLPPLPDYYKNTGNPPTPVPGGPIGTSMERKLEMAFGLGCPEIRYHIKTEMHDRGVLLAAENFEIIKDGKYAGCMKLYPLSLASFGKKLGADGTPEINTLFAGQGANRPERAKDHRRRAARRPGRDPRQRAQGADPNPEQPAYAGRQRRRRARDSGPALLRRPTRPTRSTEVA